MTLDEIRAALSDRNVLVVAKRTGLGYQTVRKIKTDPKANPTWAVMQKLAEYIRRESQHG